MSLSIGIVGLPNVGKSTLFNALTDSNALAANYPFATIEPNSSLVLLPDNRLEKLAKIYSSNKIIQASIEFVDIAGLVAGANNGDGLGNKFLSHIRECSAIIQVVRAFHSGDIIRSDSSRDPAHDIDIITTELVLADLSTVSKSLPRIEKESRANPKMNPTAERVQSIKQCLEEGTPLTKKPELLESEDVEIKKCIQSLQLLTVKPIIYVFNIDDTSINDKELRSELAKLVAPSQALFICAKLEDELRELGQNDKLELLESYGQEKSGLDQIIIAAYETLGLQSYLTAGEKEVRAWTIKKGSTAPQAAGVIHTDFERGFIAAQIVDYDDLISAGSEQAAKNAGKMRTEGKSYIMKPNDIVEFKFNV